MTNIEPYVIVRDMERMITQKYGQAGKVALIGAFPCADVQLDVYTSAIEAKNTLKGEYKLPGDNDPAHASQTVVPDSFVSFYCLDYIFNNNDMSNGPEYVLVVNTNYGASSLTNAVDNASLADALQLLQEEDFDILTIADNIKLAIVEEESAATLNPMFTTLKTFNSEMYSNQKPFGIITGIELDEYATEAICQAFQNLYLDKGFYKAVATPIRLNGESDSLNIAQSGCWHAAFTAGRAINKSETGKLYPGLIGEDSKATYPLDADITWKDLLDCGFLTMKFRNRKNMTIQCLSNITPANYDMKIERTKNYMIKRFNFTDIFGEDNNKITRAYIEGLFEHEKQIAVNNGYLLDMRYNVIGVESDKVQCNVILVIADVIRIIELNVTLEISNEMEE